MDTLYCRASCNQWRGRWGPVCSASGGNYLKLHIAQVSQPTFLLFGTRHIWQCSRHQVTTEYRSWFGTNRKYRILVNNPLEKWLLIRLKWRWEDYIKMDLEEIGFGNVDWVNVAQNLMDLSLLLAVLNLRILVMKSQSWGVGELLEIKLGIPEVKCVSYFQFLAYNMTCFCFSWWGDARHSHSCDTPQLSSQK
jgi:hypothetical protein